MPTFTQVFTVDAPLSAVAEFHKDSSALKALTPPPIIPQLRRMDPLGERSITAFTLWMGPLPVNWVAKHSDVDPMAGFTDEQIEGPFNRWVHRHGFEAIDESTSRVTDRIEVELGTHWFWGLISRMMWLGVPMMFFYRKLQTQRIVQRRHRLALKQAAA